MDFHLRHPLRLALSLSALCASALVAGSAAAWTAEFRGGGFLGDFSGCTAHWPEETHMALVRFVPSELNPEDPNSRVSFVIHSGAESFQTPGRFSQTFRLVRGHYIWAGYYSPPVRPRMRVVSQSPATIDAETQSVRVIYRIQNFDNLTGCAATLGAVMHRWPG